MRAAESATLRHGALEGFNDPNHAAQRYSWIRPPKHLPSFDRVDRRRGGHESLQARAPDDCPAPRPGRRAELPHDGRLIVRDVRPEHSLEVPTTVDQDVVKALSTLVLSNNVWADPTSIRYALIAAVSCGL